MEPAPPGDLVFVVRDRWRGVFAELTRNYSGRRFAGLHVEHAAVSAHDGDTLELWTFRERFLASLPPEERRSYQRKSSFNRAHVAAFVRDHTHASDAIRPISIPCVTVATLAHRYFTGGEFDLLVVDAEGHEAVILESLDFGSTRPGVIFFESKHLGADAAAIRARLEGAGYRIRPVGDRDSAAERI